MVFIEEIWQNKKGGLR